MRKLLLAASVILLFSCSSHEGLEGDDIPGSSSELTFEEKLSLLDNYELPEQYALNILEAFDCKVILEGDETRAQGERNKFRITNKMQVPLNINTPTRGDDDENIIVYKVQISNGDKYGYALVSGDIRNASVIAYVPDTIAAAPNIESAKAAANMMRDMSLMSSMKKIKDFNDKKEKLRKSALEKQNKANTRSSYLEDNELDDILNDLSISYVKSDKWMPLMKTTWNQGSPYNCKLPQDCEAYSSRDSRYNTGCGVVAVAQAIAYYEPKLTLYGTPVDWKSLKKTPKITASSDKNVRNQVGYLMKWIGEKGNAVYECDGTTTRDIIGDILSLVNMKCDNNTSWSWENIKSSIDKGNLVHATAGTKDKIGHAWIMDGYLATTASGYHTVNYVHNNFGWGGICDGYYELEDDIHFETFNGDFFPRNLNPNINKK